jgi:hypothetical protein
MTLQPNKRQHSRLSTRSNATTESWNLRFWGRSYQAVVPTNILSTELKAMIALVKSMSREDTKSSFCSETWCMHGILAFSYLQFRQNKQLETKKKISSRKECISWISSWRKSLEHITSLKLQRSKFSWGHKVKWKKAWKIFSVLTQTTF